MIRRLFVVSVILVQIILSISMKIPFAVKGDEFPEIQPDWFKVEWEAQRTESQATLWMCDWSPDGSMVAGVYFDRHVNIYNASTGLLKHAFDIPETRTRCDGLVPAGIAYPMRYLAFSPDSKYLAVSGDDKLVHIYSTSDWIEQKQLSGHLGAVLCVNWSPNGTWLVSGSGREKINGTGVAENVVKVWDVATGKCIRTLADQTAGPIISARFSPGGSKLAVNSDDTTICIYETGNLSLWKKLEGHTSGVLDCDWSLDEKRIVSGSRDYTARVWDLDTGENEKYEHDNCVRGARWSLANDYFLTSGIEKRARIYNPAVSEPIVMFREGEKYDSNIMASRWSPDGLRFVSALGKSRYIVMYAMEEPVDEFIIFTKTRVGLGIFSLVSVVFVIMLVIRTFKKKIRRRRG
jgi:WD40 repeat protein